VMRTEVVSSAIIQILGKVGFAELLGQVLGL